MYPDCKIKSQHEFHVMNVSKTRNSNKRTRTKEGKGLNVDTNVNCTKKENKSQPIEALVGC